MPKFIAALAGLLAAVVAILVMGQFGLVGQYELALIALPAFALGVWLTRRRLEATP